MICIENLLGERLTIGCKNITPPKYDSLKIENRLLDGSYHVQTIGNPLKRISLNALVTQEQAEKINLIQTNFELIMLINKKRTYTGYIESNIDWNRFGDITRKKYTGEITIIINGEGAI